MARELGIPSSKYSAIEVGDLTPSRTEDVMLIRRAFQILETSRPSGRQIRLARQALGMSLIEFAEVIGHADSYYWSLFERADICFETRMPHRLPQDVEDRVVKFIRKVARLMTEDI